MITNTVLKEGITNTAQYSSPAVEDLSRQIMYVDGFGRPKQQVNWQGSPFKKDIVTIVEYDNMGRQPKSYLPYTSGNNGAFKSTAKADQLAFYLNTPNVDTTTKPFSETEFERSGAETVLQKSEEGYSWQIGNGHTTTILTRPSDAGDVVRLFEYNFTSGVITSSISYMAGDLLVTETKDEQGVYSYSYADKKGLAVLNKEQAGPTEYSYTYNVYDAFGNLRVVIQPEGVKELMTSGNWTLTSAFIDKWCFTYDYDEWGRQVCKKIPGAQPDYNVYNQKDQLVCEQDGELRKKNQWIVNKYDALGRYIITGIYTHTAAISQANLQAAVSDNMGAGYENRTADNYSTQHGYTLSQTYPALTTSNSEILSANYFDDYDYDNNATTSNASFMLLGLTNEPVPSFRTLGISTGNKQKVLDLTPVKYMLSSVFYDGRGKIVQTSSDNLAGGKDIITSYTDFSGKVTETVQYHNANGNTVYLKKKFYYDHGGRLLSKTHQVVKTGTTYPSITPSVNSYNELGQTIQTKLHSENGSTFLQSVDYRYNIRGWLIAINNAGLSDAGDLFGEEIKYNTVTAGHPFPVAPRFDGSIGEIWWKDAYSNKQQSYTYNYDLQGRLTSAKYAAKNATQYLEPEGNDEIISYDLNGNIKTLSRNQWPSGATAKQNIDALTYTYAGNQLKKIDENAGTYAGTGFVNGITDPDEYIYDANGNIITDKNKGITYIKYNLYNLPTEINITNQGKIIYTYDASGDKLRKQIIPLAGAPTTTDYIEGFEYQNGILQFAATDDGRVLLQSTPGYEYVLKDHLGNTRVNFDKNPATGTARVIQKTDYYPYGMTLSGNYTPGTQNKYQYNGKELQDELNLNWYNYGARMYDPQIARWNALDPVAENYYSATPYNYVLGDPVTLIDPDGMQVRPPASGNIPRIDYAKQRPGIVRRAVIFFAEIGYQFGDNFLNTARHIRNDVRMAVNSPRQYAQHVRETVADAVSTVTHPRRTARQVRDGAVQKAQEFRNADGDGKTAMLAHGTATGIEAVAAVYGPPLLSNKDGFLIGGINMKAPFDIPVQRFGGIPANEVRPWGLKMGPSMFVNRTLVAIKPKWNPLTNYHTGVIPKGIPMKFGIIGPQQPIWKHPGGLFQFNVKTSDVDKIVSKIIPRK